MFTLKRPLWHPLRSFGKAYGSALQRAAVASKAYSPNRAIPSRPSPGNSAPSHQPPFSTSTPPSLPVSDSAYNPGLQQAYDGIDDEVTPFSVEQYKASFSNAVTLTGRLGRDPELRPVNDAHVAAMSMAFTNERGASNWVDIEAWSPLAYRCHRHLAKGMQVQVHGTLQIDTWSDKETQKPRSKAVVRAKDFWIIRPPSEGEKHNQTQSLWEEYRRSPTSFWDNRVDKRNPNAPDFKHKVQGTGLWLDSHSRPSWINPDGERVLE